MTTQQDALMAIKEIHVRLDDIKVTAAAMDRALEFAEYMATSAEAFLDAANKVALAEEKGNQTDIDHADTVRTEAYSALRNDIYEFRKRVARIPEATCNSSQDAPAAEKQ